MLSILPRFTIPSFPSLSNNSRLQESPVKPNPSNVHTFENYGDLHEFVDLKGAEFPDLPTVKFNNIPFVLLEDYEPAQEKSPQDLTRGAIFDREHLIKTGEWRTMH